ncbi:xanthine dehydrogenase family protein molybdopterin-binding subunit [Kineosporia sp. A_224]|uniref:xanthine dehydrogenase family protein molybdopterin-binding subunit n=1 Tax=Kineosporia sp. A_224 TaxID=1962180 RepID=UPI000B4AE957|nr:xanthine dehydrogenase family protein molybdopterin-binding subunit [Kineosporia sp. A_224]
MSVIDTPAQGSSTPERPRAFIRPDGKEKVTGLGRYTADLTFTGQLHAAFRYADHPHARIVSIDTSRAKALPGVFAVVTHEDVPDVRYGGMTQDRRLFAKEKVLWEGDVVAGVAARTVEIARQAAALVEVEYEVLPAQPDYVANMAPDAPVLHEGWAEYGADENLVRDGNVMSRYVIAKGDADAAMAGADVVVKSHYVSDASQGVPIEPRALVAQWTGDSVTVWSSTQVPFAARSGVAHTLQIPESKVRIVVPLLGGGFGSKCDFHFEAHVAILAKVTRRPVRLVFTRKEEFVAPDHRREGMDIELETGVTRDGRIVARRGRMVLDKGAYTGEGGFFAQMAAMHACGPYKLDTVRVEAFLNYSTNQPAASIRAPTAPQACWALEQHLDEVAAAIGMDPVELRRRTLVAEGDEGPAGQVFEKIGAKETLEAALELIGYDAYLRGELPDDEAVGVACGWWPCFGVPSGAYVKLNGDGTATIVTGAQENGSGSVMGLPILAAEILGMSPSDFSINYQDTDAGPWDMGSSGSQTTFNNGRAVVEAAQEVRAKLLAMGAEKLEADVADLELADGTVRVKGAPETSVTIADLAGTGEPILGKGSGEVPEAAASDASACVGSLGMESFLAPQLITHAARVKVDRDTGVVRVLDFAAAHDSGVIVNKVGADGQVYGGVMMGIGQALTEATWTDEEGRQKNPGLLDYKLQTASDGPRIQIRWIEIETPNAGPKGSKGVGEPPSVPTSGAVGNAIAKVIGRHVDQLPMTAERVWLAANSPAGEDQ